jgi:hypothetical protein
MVEEPQVHRHHVVDEHEVARLLAGAVAAVLAEQLDLALLAELVELVEGDAGHAALVLLARAVDVEVAEARHLALHPLEVLAALAPHALVEQQLAVAVHVQRPLELRRLAEGVGAAIDRGRRRVQQPRAALLAGLEQRAGHAVVVVHHVLAVLLHRVAAGALVEHGLDLAEAALGEEGVELVGVDVVGDLQVRQVAELVALGQVVDRDDVVDAAGVEALDDVAADESGSSGDTTRVIGTTPRRKRGGAELAHHDAAGLVGDRHRVAQAAGPRPPWRPAWR